MLTFVVPSARVAQTSCNSTQATHIHLKRQYNKANTCFEYKLFIEPNILVKFHLAQNIIA